MPNNVNLQITNNPSYIFYIDKNRVADLEGKCVPRIRGDDPGATEPHWALNACSPHTRG